MESITNNPQQNTHEVQTVCVILGMNCIAFMTTVGTHFYILNLPARLFFPPRKSLSIAFLFEMGCQSLAAIISVKCKHNIW